MSRRSGHGARPHGQRPHRRDSQRPETGVRPPPDRADLVARPATVTVADEPGLDEPFASEFEPAPAQPIAPAAPSVSPPVGATPVPPPAGPPSVPSPAGARTSTGCTAAQLRRFIKSRAYVPMHELRRRFAINGAEDDVTWVDTPDGRLFVGLPPREAQLLGELIRSGDVGVERSLDPVSPIVIGVYPMRPVTRT